MREKELIVPLSDEEFTQDVIDQVIAEIQNFYRQHPVPKDKNSKIEEIIDARRGGFDDIMKKYRIYHPYQRRYISNCLKTIRSGKKMHPYKHYNEDNKLEEDEL